MELKLLGQGFFGDLYILLFARVPSKNKRANIVSSRRRTCRVGGEVGTLVQRGSDYSIMFALCDVGQKIGRHWLQPGFGFGLGPLV